MLAGRRGSAGGFACISILLASTPTTLGRTKTSMSRAEYDDEASDIVADVCTEDIRTFGYDFDSLERQVSRA